MDRVVQADFKLGLLSVYLLGCRINDLNCDLMKKANFYLFLLSILTFGCGEENAYEIQNLNDGEFIIKLYNSNGDLLLTRKGDAENLVSMTIIGKYDF